MAIDEVLRPRVDSAAPFTAPATGRIRASFFEADERASSYRHGFVDTTGLRISQGPSVALAGVGFAVSVCFFGFAVAAAVTAPDKVPLHYIHYEYFAEWTGFVSRLATFFVGSLVALFVGSSSVKLLRERTILELGRGVLALRGPYRSSEQIEIPLSEIVGVRLLVNHYETRDFEVLLTGERKLLLMPMLGREEAECIHGLVDSWFEKAAARRTEKGIGVG